MNKKALMILGVLYAVLITLQETGIIDLLPIEEGKKNLYRALGTVLVVVIGVLIGKKKSEILPYPPDKTDKVK